MRPVTQGVLLLALQSLAQDPDGLGGGLHGGAKPRYADADAREPRARHLRDRTVHVPRQLVPSVSVLGSCVQVQQASVERCAHGWLAQGDARHFGGDSCILEDALVCRPCKVTGEIPQALQFRF